ncbi:aluminum-activated malate transporter 9-like [Prosopis cineraria]|uniref:aluminum-activated malate transporter 9-like n=1 Tax=Prosopis cineraria TaxID=364024 RepID=UPI00241045FC|nr:aluminum-activated malate transporter 9-like [Prosopis cineraria]
MNAKQGSIEISIPTSTKSDKKCESRGLCKALAQNIWEICKEDKGKAIFGVKVGVAALLVSSLVLFEAPYQALGTNTIWAILTAILVFEYTVGETFNRGFNRALGSLLAGILAIAVAETALSCGHVAQPIIIGFSIFMIAAVTSFMKTWPWLKQYEYGFRVILLAYCLIITAGYRMGNPIKTAVDRLYSMVIGGIISVLVNVIVFPIWAGELLHKELVINFDSVADSLKECVKKYLQDDGREHSRFRTTVMDEFRDEPAYTRCQNTLNSGPQLETLANSAKWEPPHGRFLHFFYPWSEYQNVGAALRYCAYEVMALHCILHSQIQAPYNLRMTFGSEIQEVSDQAAELVRELGRDINNMKWSIKSSLIKKVHSSTERLQRSSELHAYILTSTLESKHLTVSKLSHAQSMSSSSSTAISTVALAPDQTADLDPEKNSNTQAKNAGDGISPAAQQTECYHEMMRRQFRRIYSWPSIEVDAFDGDYGTTSDLLPRMRALESTAALSLTNFTSTLVEFVARLDHLIQAVDKLSKKAKFKHESL